MSLQTGAPAPAAPASRGRRLVGLLARLAASAAVAIVCYQMAPWAEMRTTLAETDWLAVGLGCLALLAANAVSSWKASWILEGLGGSPGPWYCFRAYMGGFFFNQFLPMGAGDVHRFLALGRATNRWLAVGSTLFLERWTGLQALILVSSLALLGEPGFRTGPLLFLAGAALAGTVAVSLLLCVADLRSLRLPGERLQALAGSLAEARPPRAVLARIFAVSLVQPFLTAAFYHGVFAGAGWQMPGLLSLLVSGYVTLLIQIPFFVNGLGIQEAGLLALGATPTVLALSGSVLAHVGRSVVGLVGGAILVLEVNASGLRWFSLPATPDQARADG